MQLQTDRLSGIETVLSSMFLRIEDGQTYSITIKRDMKENLPLSLNIEEGEIPLGEDTKYRHGGLAEWKK